MLLTIESILEELREQAEEAVLDAPFLRLEEVTETEAADLIVELRDALAKIAGGAPNPAELARAVLDPIARMQRQASKPRPKPRPFDPLL